MIHVDSVLFKYHSNFELMLIKRSPSEGYMRPEVDMVMYSSTPMLDGRGSYSKSIYHAAIVPHEYGMRFISTEEYSKLKDDHKPMETPWDSLECKCDDYSIPLSQVMHYIDKFSSLDTLQFNTGLLEGEVSGTHFYDFKPFLIQANCDYSIYVIPYLTKSKGNGIEQSNQKLVSTLEIVITSHMMDKALWFSNVPFTFTDDKCVRQETYNVVSKGLAYRFLGMFEFDIVELCDINSYIAQHVDADTVRDVDAALYTAIEYFNKYAKGIDLPLIKPDTLKSKYGTWIEDMMRFCT